MTDFKETRYRSLQALLQRALIELRSLEKDIEIVISDDSLADNIEAALLHGQGPSTPA